MAEDVFTKILKSIYSYAEDAVLCLGFLGEVALHPLIFDYITRAAEMFSKVYIETNGYEWELSHTCWNTIPKNVSWIVYVDAFSEGVYSTIRKLHHRDTYSVEDKFSKTKEFIDFLSTKTESANIFAQATRMPENEGELDNFCRHWKEKGINPIVQKYNNVCTLLPDKKVVDIAPIKRFACRHLERDIVIDIDGNVIMCFQDIYKKEIQGNIMNTAIEELWGKNEKHFTEQVKEKYLNICRSCDEYYTCNE